MTKSVHLLGLNIIVGPDDKDVLERCLKSCVGDLFDEIVITLSMPKDDPEIRVMAESYGAKTFFFKWVDDFSAARNFSFSNNTSQYILWLDSDDIIKPPEYQKLLKLKPQLINLDIVIMNYVYSHDDKDNPIMILPRERIVKNCDHIKWHDPIHEYMNLDVPQDRLKRVDINIDHYRIKSHNPARNIEALKKVYESGSCSERIKFYYGKELADFGSWDKAVSVLDPYIKKGADFADNLTTACIKLARYYTEKKDFFSAKNYALKGIRFNSRYAENYVILGSVFENDGDHDTAVSYYKEALTKNLDGGMSQIVDYYGFIPAAKLALIYYNQKDYEKSMEYCSLALKHKPDNKQMVELCKMITNEEERLSKGMTLKEEDIPKIKEILEKNDFSMSILKNNFDFCDLRLKKIRNLKVMWLVPTIDSSNPSIRLRRLNVCDQMVEMGIDSTILTTYYGKNIFDLRNTIDDTTIVIFTQFSKEDLELMKHLKSVGIKCVFDHCEAIFNYPFENECMGEADLITCCSTKLEEITNEHGFMRTVVLKDAVENIKFKVDHQYKRDWE